MRKEPFVLSEVCVFQYYWKNRNKNQPQSQGIRNKTSLEEQRAPKQPPFFISAPFRPTLKSSRWKSAACARIPAASPRHTKDRRSCFPYGARPWSCKIINPMAARAGCDSLPGPKKQRVTTYLSVTREVLSQAYLNRRASSRALQKRTPPNLPSLLGPYMSDEPYGATRISNQSEG